MADARQRRFDVVLVWKLDRWGRSLVQSLHSIQELASVGVRFVAITQNIDTDESNPMARFMLHIFEAFAEFEREMIRSEPSPGSGKPDPPESPSDVYAGCFVAMRSYGSERRGYHGVPSPNGSTFL